MPPPLSTLRQLSNDFIARLVAYDPRLRKAAHSLNASARDYHEAFAMATLEVPAWSALHRVGHQW